MNSYEIERFNIYCILLSKYIKKPTKQLKKELEAVKSGLIPVKYLMKQEAVIMAKGKRELIIEVMGKQLSISEFKRMLESQLKVNGVKEGTISYGKVVNLLLTYYALYGK